MSGSPARPWLLLAAVASLALGGRIEYRQIPEYGGYFPVEHSKPDRRVVRAYWVLPGAEDLSAAYHPPGSPHEAKQRVRKHRGKGRFLKPLAPLLWLPGIAGAVEYYAHVRPERLDEARLAALRELVGTGISIRVVDRDASALAAARVHVAIYPKGIPVYVDTAGSRSFAAQLPVAYTPSAGWVAAKVDGLPIYLGTRCDSHPAFRLGVTPWEAGLDPVFQHQSDAEGNVHLTSLEFARFAAFTPERGWQWLREPTPLEVHAIAWSPGHEARGASAQLPEPGTPAAITLALEPVASVAEARQAHRAFHRTLAELCGALDYRRSGRDRGWHRDELAVTRAIRQLGELLRTPGLPDYLRWNAREALADLSRAAFAITAPLAAEAQEILADEGTSGSSWAPTWSGRGVDGSPWQLSARIDQWFDDLEGGLEPHPRLSVSQRLGIGVAGIPREYLHPGAPVSVDPVADARALLSELGKLDPEHPAIGALHAAIALGEGEREKALPHTRFLNHTDFFALFYPGLGVEAPEWRRDGSP